MDVSNNGDSAVTAGLQAKQISTSHKKDHFRVSSRARLFLGVVLAVVTIAVYHSVHDHPFFTIDDQHYLDTANDQVQNGLNWKTVEWAFTSLRWANWHPLTWLSHALDCWIYGLNPSGHHDTNMVLHALDAVLLFWVLERATGYIGRSFMVAALFALHPINVEAVAWIAERKTMLSMLFFLLALAAYLRYAQRPSVGRYSGVVLLYALGLMSKPQVITLPVVLLLWDYWPLQRMFAPSRQGPSETAPVLVCPGRSFSWLLLEKVPLLVLSAASAAITVYAQRRFDSWGFPVLIRLENALVSYVRYIGKALWPSGLAPEYPHPGLSLRPWQGWGAFAILLAISALVWAGRRHRYLVVGWLWFLITLLPMIGLLQVGRQGMADRYAYVSFVGLFIMICWGVADFSPRRGESGSWEFWDFHRKTPENQAAGESREWAGKLPTYVGWRSGISLAVLLALAAVTYRQVGFWKDNMVLWRHAASVIKNDWIAEDSIGVALYRMGRPDEEVLPHFFKASAMRPIDAVSNMHIATYEQSHGNPREAIARYQRVLLDKLLDNQSQIQAQIYQKMGLAYQELGDPAKAQECFDRAVTLRLKP